MALGIDDIRRFVPLDHGLAIVSVGLPSGGVASSLVNAGVVTTDYVQQFRTSQEADGLQLGRIETVMIDGEQAAAWDFDVEQGQPIETLNVRDVVLVRPDGAWQIRFVSTPDAYAEARLGFEKLLAAWRWTS